MNARSYLSIGQVLDLLKQEFPDLTISKIRFLESQGLLDPERTPSGYRKFYDPDVERLRFILRAQQDQYLPLKVIKGRLGEDEGGDDAGAAEPASEGGEAGEGGEGGDVPAPRGMGGAPAGAPGSRGGGGTGAGGQGGGGAGSQGGGGAGSQGGGTGPGGHAGGAGGAGAGTGAMAGAAGAPNGTSAAAYAAPTAVPSEAALHVPRPRREDVDLGASRHPSVIAAPPGRAAPGAALRTVPDEGDDASLTLDELATVSGLSTADLAELERFGLITGRRIAGTTYYDTDCVTIAGIAARFRTFGVEARHLRMYRTAVEREAGFFEQVVTPMLKQRNPQARRQAVDALLEMSRLGSAMRESVLRLALREHTGGIQ